MDWGALLKEGIPVKVQHQVTGTEGITGEINTLKWIVGGVVGLWIIANVWGKRR